MVSRRTSAGRSRCDLGRTHPLRAPAGAVPLFAEAAPGARGEFPGGAAGRNCGNAVDSAGSPPPLSALGAGGTCCRRLQLLAVEFQRAHRHFSSCLAGFGGVHLREGVENMMEKGREWLC